MSTNRKLLHDLTSWVTVGVMVGASLIFAQPAHANISGQMKFYLHKENSATNEAYNAMTFTPPEASLDTSLGTTPANTQHKSANGSSAVPQVVFTSTPTQNHLLVAFVFSQSATAVTMTSAGWTAGTSGGGGSGGNSRDVRMFWKIAGAAESSTVTAASGNAAWTISVAEYSGIDTSTPLNGTVGGTAESGAINASGTNTTPSVTPNAGTKMLLVGGLAVKSASSTYSTQSFTGNGAGVANVEETNSSANGTSTLFDNAIGSSLSSYHGSAIPGTAAIGGGSIAVFRAASSVSSTVVGATPPTTFCESSGNNVDNGNVIAVNSAATGNYCVGTFISQPMVGSAGGTIALATGDTASIAGQFWSTESDAAVTAAMNIYLYRWSGSGTTVSSGDRIATITAPDPTASTVTSYAPAAVAPANNVTFSAGDRLVAIVSLNVTAAAASTTAAVYFDSTGRTASSVQMGYTTYGYNSSNKPALSGTLDDDFTTDSATTSCAGGGSTYNTKWSCFQPAATNSVAKFNAAATSTPSGDTTGWLWLENQITNTATISNFGATPSNAFLYQTLPGDYGNGNVTTVINSSGMYDIGNSPSTSVSPYSNSGLVLWTSNTDYLEIQVYADGAVNDTGTNKVHVALNSNGSLTGAVNLDSATTGNTYDSIWVRFANTGGSYQAQYSTDGTSFTNVGSTTAHVAFTRVGLNAFSAINVASAYAGAFEWFSDTFAAATYTQDAYMWDDHATTASPPGASLAANNTAFTLTSTGQQFRLRLDLTIAGQSLATGSPTQFKLQYAGKGAGTCASPSGTPGSYTDVTGSTLIAYFNDSPADGATISLASGKDPTPTGSTTTNQPETYEEANNFSATNNNLPSNGDDGLWDFSLFDNGSGGGLAYCFKVVVASGGGSMLTPSNYPQITTLTVGAPTTDQLLRGGHYFNAGVKQGFYWAN